VNTAFVFRWLESENYFPRPAVDIAIPKPQIPLMSISSIMDPCTYCEHSAPSDRSTLGSRDRIVTAPPNQHVLSHSQNLDSSLSARPRSSWPYSPDVLTLMPASATGTDLPPAKQSETIVQHVAPMYANNPAMISTSQVPNLIMPIARHIAERFPSYTSRHGLYAMGGANTAPMTLLAVAVHQFLRQLVKGGVRQLREERVRYPDPVTAASYSHRSLTATMDPAFILPNDNAYLSNGHDWVQSERHANMMTLMPDHLRRAVYAMVYDEEGYPSAPWLLNVLERVGKRL
jgi:hypothetical protein